MEIPIYNFEKDGVTQSLLYNWLLCRKKASLWLNRWTRKGGKQGFMYGFICHHVAEEAYDGFRLTGEKPNVAKIKGWVAKGQEKFIKENPEMKEVELQALELNWVQDLPRLV